jgi:hypothetical protein
MVKYLNFYSSSFALRYFLICRVFPKHGTPPYAIDTVGKSSNEDGLPPPHAIDTVGKPSMSRRCTKVVL